MSSRLRPERPSLTLHYPRGTSTEPKACLAPVGSSRRSQSTSVAERQNTDGNDTEMLDAGVTAALTDPTTEAAAALVTLGNGVQGAIASVSNSGKQGGAGQSRAKTQQAKMTTILEEDDLEELMDELDAMAAKAT